jgi:hypothetical protein
VVVGNHDCVYQATRIISRTINMAGRLDSVSTLIQSFVRVEISVNLLFCSASSSPILLELRVITKTVYSTVRYAPVEANSRERRID